MKRTKPIATETPPALPKLSLAEIELAERQARAEALWPSVPLDRHDEIAERVRRRFMAAESPADWRDRWQWREAAVAAWGMMRKAAREARRGDQPAPFETPRKVTMTKERERALIEAARSGRHDEPRADVPGELWEYT